VITLLGAGVSLFGLVAVLTVGDFYKSFGWLRGLFAVWGGESDNASP